MMKFHTVPLVSVDKVNHLFVQYALPISHSIAIIGYLEISQCCVQVTLILLNNGPKAQG